MKTLVLGASNNPSRYSYLATEKLLANEHEVVLLGNKKGEVFGLPMLIEVDEITEIDTVTMYLSEKNQKDYEDFILELKPRRVIFNPGAENYNFAKELKKQNIETLEACTLVMLGTGQY